MNPNINKAIDIFNSEDPVSAILENRDFFPFIEKEMMGVVHPKVHCEGDVWDHTALVINNLRPGHDWVDVMIALFHDAGKKRALDKNEGTAVSPQVLGYIFQHGLYHQDNPVTHWADEYRELANYEPGDYPKPSVTVTSVVINGIGESTIGREDQVLLVRRKKFPFANYWCLPGGFTNPHESVEESAARELNEETGLPVDVGLFRQLKVYLPDDPRADLRYRANNEDRQADELVERGSYLANIDGIRAYAKELRNHWVYDVGVYARGTFGPVKGDDDAAEAAWFPLSVARRTRLAFHHNQILEDYVKAIGR